ncbi:MAG: carbon-nitrogen hydrolase [Gemmatales bacterium]|nr:carbon-nitrogen hydrolase [Gemmatales bacterium]MCS7161505.1 carbon-nitrogen hydrolase [Gemmatales bacterium]MDW8176708.1 carbon-nitrogen hydrolase [Gemmatales bacterium]MDW8221809.1 carbon-nitrogen hydrolase [Gemmatales bacterium]
MPVRTEKELLALLQMRCEDDPEANVARAERMIVQAREQGARLVVLPELFKTRYFCQWEDPRFFDLAEPIPGPTTVRMQALAKKLGVVLVVPLFEVRAAGLYHNSAAILDADGTLLGVYRKMHIPHDPLYYEKYYFTPGDTGFRTWATQFGKISVLICWDQWFPEAARLSALQGAEILIYPTAIGWHPQEKAQWGLVQQQAWETVQRAHAITNGLFVAAVNRVGHEGPAEGGLDFWGNSFVCDPYGRILAQGSSDREEIVLAPMDRTLIETMRRHWPFLRDRRIDAYQDLVRRFLD